MSAIVKPNLEDRADSKAGMPDYQNVETIDPIPTRAVSFMPIRSVE